MDAVTKLTQAGATLSGSDGVFAKIAMILNATGTSDGEEERSWSAAGFQLQSAT